VTCRHKRSQLRNKQIALRELRDRLEALNRPTRRRISTAVPGRVRAMTSKQRKRRSVKKERNTTLRKKPKPGE